MEPKLNRVDFNTEIDKLLAYMEDALLQLEQRPDDMEIVNGLFAATHSIKGLAAVFDFEAAVLFTHLMESLLEEIRTGYVVVDTDLIALLLLCGDHLSALFKQAAGKNAILDDDIQAADIALVTRLRDYLGEYKILPETIVQADDEPVEIQTDQNAGQNGSIPTVLEQQSIVEELQVNERRDKERRDKERRDKEHRAIESSFMRVRADKLDELITLVGELVIAGAGTRLLAQRANNNELIESASTLEGLVEQIRDGALRLRMVPIGDTFNRFNRVVRDLGKELNKQIELVISGADTELDKSMVDKIGDPLMHLVRNSLDHGIESAEVRAARGKPETGQMNLNAYHDSGSIVIEVGDDGGGLNRDKILAKARERGLVAPDQHLGDQDIYNLIMEPGFSTAEEVTNVSGRGMGMDVVKRNVEALRGNINIDSTPGVGTTIAIRLPLTLAIIDGFVVGVGESSYVVPLDMVVECIELSEADRASIKTRSYVNLREEVLPLLRLRDAFEVSGAESRRENIVVVKYAGMQAGLVVDVLLGEFQTVIKPLGKLFEKLSGISGSTILGTGEVALILDVPLLVQAASNKEVQPVSSSPLTNSVLA